MERCSWVGCARTASLEGSTGFAFATRERATWAKAASTFSPVFADVSINATWYSLAKRCPSSRLTALSKPLSDLLPAITTIYTQLGDPPNFSYKRIILPGFKSARLGSLVAAWCYVPFLINGYHLNNFPIWTGFEIDWFWDWGVQPNKKSQYKV